jgi:hypothetical protein
MLRFWGWNRIIADILLAIPKPKNFVSAARRDSMTSHIARVA